MSNLEPQSKLNYEDFTIVGDCVCYKGNPIATLDIVLELSEMEFSKRADGVIEAKRKTKHDGH